MSARFTRGHAAVCGQGHVVSPDTKYLEDTAYCSECGARVYTRCPACDAEIPGILYAMGPVTGSKRVIRTFERPGFCSSCGSAFPWIERAELISQLINQLDDEDMTPAERLEAREELGALSDPDLPEKEQRERWERVKDLAPKVMASSGRILERLAGEAIRQALGL